MPGVIIFRKYFYIFTILNTYTKRLASISLTLTLTITAHFYRDIIIDSSVSKPVSFSCSDSSSVNCSVPVSQQNIEN